MKVFINQEEDSKDWHSWIEETFEEEDIKYQFNEEDLNEETEKADSDFILYVINEESNLVQAISNVVDDSNKFNRKVILFIDFDDFKEDEENKDSLKDMESTVVENGGKSVNALQHALNYINYIDREGFPEDESEESESEDEEMVSENISSPHDFNIVDDIHKQSGSLKDKQQMLLANIESVLSDTPDLKNQFDELYSTFEEIKNYNNDNVDDFIENTLEPMGYDFMDAIGEYDNVLGDKLNKFLELFCEVILIGGIIWILEKAIVDGVGIFIIDGALALFFPVLAVFGGGAIGYAVSKSLIRAIERSNNSLQPESVMEEFSDLSSSEINRIKSELNNIKQDLQNQNQKPFDFKERIYKESVKTWEKEEDGSVSVVSVENNNSEIVKEYSKIENDLGSDITSSQLFSELKTEINRARELNDEEELKEHIENNIIPLCQALMEKHQSMSGTERDLKEFAGLLLAFIILGLVTVIVGFTLTTVTLILLIVSIAKAVSIVVKTPFRAGAFLINKTKEVIDILISNDPDNVRTTNLTEFKATIKDRVTDSELFQESVMEVEYYLESPRVQNGIDKLSESEINSHLSNTLSLNSKVKDFIAGSNKIKPEQCEVDFNRFEKKQHSFKDDIIKGIENENIVLLYNDTTSLSKFMLYLPMFKSRDDYILYINATSLCKETEIVSGGKKDYEYEFNHYKNLENLLIAGYSLIQTAKNPDLIRGNYKVRNHLFDLYSEMMVSTFNRMSSIGTRSDNADILKYILCKYIHLGMLDMEYNDKVEEACVNMADAKGHDKLEVIDMKYGVENFETIGGMFEVVSGTLPQVEVDLPSFIKIHTILFGEGTLLCIDYAPYLVALAFSERFNFSVYTSSKNLKKNLKLQANRLQTDLLEIIK